MVNKMTGSAMNPREGRGKGGKGRSWANDKDAKFFLASSTTSVIGMILTMKNMEKSKHILSTFHIQIVILSIWESAAFLITGRGETRVEYEVGMISYK